MSNSLIKIRSGFVQAGFNERMASIVSYELAYASIAGAILMAYLWGWQWFFWGIFLIPVALSIGLCIPVICDTILVLFGLLWAMPFFLIAILGIDAFYIGAVFVFFISLWVHSKAFSWYADLSRSND